MIRSVLSRYSSMVKGDRDVYLRGRVMEELGDVLGSVNDGEEARGVDRIVC